MNTNSISIATTFLWIGFVCAISFMEAWLKFTAPGMTLSTGLAVGQVVFNALNKVELVFGIIIFIAQSMNEARFRPDPYYAVAFLIVLTQSIYLLPELSARIDIYRSGGTPKGTVLHIVYVILEVVKVILLTASGFLQLEPHFKLSEVLSASTPRN